MTAPIDPRLAGVPLFSHDMHVSSAASEARAASAPNDPVRAAKLKAAREFEQVLLRQMLQGLEKASKIDPKGGFLSSGGDMYGSMMVDALAQALSAGGGIGLANMLVQATDPHPTAGAPAPAAAPSLSPSPSAAAPASGSSPSAAGTAVPNQNLLKDPEP